MSLSNDASGENLVGFFRAQWTAMSAEPHGPARFSAMLGEIAPYTATIGATVVALGPKGSRVVLDDRPEVRSHLGCILAIALANLAEMTGGTALSWQMPPAARFIVAGLSIDHTAKARGRITAEGVCPPIPSTARAEYPVRVTMRNEAGEVVATATLRVLVGPRRGADVA